MEPPAVKSHPQTPEKDDKTKNKDDSSDAVSNLSEISKKANNAGPSPQKALYIFSNIFEK